MTKHSTINGTAAITRLRQVEQAYRARRSIMMDAARDLLAGRLEHRNNRTFGPWLRRNGFAHLSKHERASMIALAKHERKLRQHLKSATIASPIVLWRRARRLLASRDLKGR